MDESIYTLGGAVWINLLNTVRMKNKKATDTLAPDTSLLRWLELNGILSAASPEPEPQVLERACAELASLRELCLRSLTAWQVQGGLTDGIISELQARVEALQVRPMLGRTPGGQPALMYQGETLPHQAVHAVIRSLLHTLGEVSPDRIRECEHEECILRFVDTSKSGRRRWCSMERCGNRHKAAEFYAKKKQHAREDGTG